MGATIQHFERIDGIDIIAVGPNPFIPIYANQVGGNATPLADLADASMNHILRLALIDGYFQPG